MIVGSAGTASALPFAPGTGAEELAEAVETAVGDLGRQSGDPSAVLILTDLPGGTPSRVAATLAATTGAETVTGVNLPMLAEVLLADPGLSALELAALAYRTGRQGVIDLGAAIRDQEASS